MLILTWPEGAIGPSDLPSGLMRGHFGSSPGSATEMEIYVPGGSPSSHSQGGEAGSCACQRFLL